MKELAGFLASCGLALLIIPQTKTITGARSSIQRQHPLGRYLQ